MLYPTVSDYWNSRTQTRVVMGYEAALQEMDTNQFAQMFAQADAYNQQLRQVMFPLMNYHEVPGYEELLNPQGNGVMGIITIEKIHVHLPIYHTVSESVLAVAVGHLPGTSLPVGGEGTHAVLSAHRGLPSARLFSDLDQLREGDIFKISVLNQVLTYEVDQIRIVEPEELEDIAPVDGKDYCTLMTCTPYGVNTHRMLIRGVRIDEQRPQLYIFPEAYRMDSLILAPIVAAPMLLVLLVLLLVKSRKKKRKTKGDNTL